MSGAAIEMTLMQRKSAGKDTAAAASAECKLIERAQEGDAAAFEEILTAHERRVLSIALRLLGSREEARDAAQEIFLRVYRNLKRFDPRRDFGAWIYRIAVNVCRDQMRKRLRRRARFNPDIDPAWLEAVAGHENPEKDALRAGEVALAAEALAALPDGERAALVLRDLEGFSTEEVASLLGSRPTTVRSQISMARARLREFRQKKMSRSAGQRRPVP